MTLQRESVLAVFAHPDDEIFFGGTLASLADRGTRVTLACATAGEAGKVHPSLGHVSDLGATRMSELACSCRRLGIEPPVFLGFHDSARKERQRRDDPRALANVDMLEVEAAVRDVIRAVRPRIIITFDPHGGYYHPDHVAVHRATTAAFFSSGTLGHEAPERLFLGVMPPDAFRALAQRTRGRGIVDGLDPDVFSTDQAMIAMTFDARPYIERKLSALAAHRSQFGVTDEILRDPPRDVAGMLDGFRTVFQTETFAIGGTRRPIARWPMSDLFDGLIQTP